MRPHEADHLVDQLRHHFRRQPMTDGEARALADWFTALDLGIANTTVARLIRDDDRMPSVRRIHRVYELEAAAVAPPAQPETGRERGLRWIEEQRRALRDSSQNEGEQP